MARDYYDILGVARDADADTLKRAYRKLAMKHHPDKNPGDAKAEQTFKDVNEAYGILRDDKKRAAYDRFGHAAFTEQGGGGPSGGFGGGGFGGFADIFEEMFGDAMGGQRRGRPGRGADLRHNLEISLEDAFHGRTVSLTVPSHVNCSACGGAGTRDGSAPDICTTCGGRGQVRNQQGFFTVQRTCPTCRGAGTVINDPCRACHGSGLERRDKTLSVDIPRGVEDGNRIRLSGEGEPGPRGAAPGDLYIFLTVRPHPLFQREGRDIFCRVPIAMADAALGGEVEIATIDGGRARVRVPTGAQGGQRFRLRGKGMTGLRGRGRGDMIVEIGVETPVNLTARQKALLKEFRQETTSAHNPQSEGFFQRVREFWNDIRQ